MQTPDKKIFRDMQEHPEKYSDQELEAMMDDLDQMPDVDMAWQQFCENEELRVKSEEFATVHPTAQHNSQFSILNFQFRKIAAMLVGILMLSGIAFAAIYSLTPSPSPKGEGSSYIQTSDTIRQSSLPLEGTGKSTPVVYDNTPLERMLPEIGVHYGVEVVFENDDVRGLRFRFVWHPERGIEQVVGDLNQFERLTVRLKDHQITVE